MGNGQLIERSPVRAVAAAVRGGLEAGQIGAVMARAGIGKSAFLIHVALNHVLRGTPVLHVSLTDGHARVRSMYDEIFAEVANAARLTDRASARVDIERNRVIHSCLDGGFDPADMARLITSVTELMHFRPTVVLVDGLDVSALDAPGWRAVARDRGIRIWLAVRMHRDSGPAVDELVPRFDTAVTLTPAGKDVALRVLRAGGQPFDQPEALSLDPVTMLVRPEDVTDAGTAPPSPSPAACTLFSGGATGAEAAFGEQAEKWGLNEVNFTFEGHNQARTQGSRVLDERELAAGDVSLVYVAHRLHRHWDKTEILRRVLQTQWHVVSHAQQIFVVGVIQPDGTVHGGTGWSVELAKRWNKRVWVFDQEHGAWFTWNGASWTRGAPVVESPDVAGTGTRFLNDAGRAAIADLFERSFG
jgi:hypothetical protein